MTEPPAPTMVYECHLTEADYQAFRSHFLRRYLNFTWLYVCVFFLLLVMTWFSDRELPLRERVYALVGGVVIYSVLGVVAIVLFRLLQRRVNRRFPGPLGKHVFEVTPDAFRERNEYGSSEILLPGIKCVDETKEHFFVLARSGVGHIVPKRCLGDFTALTVLSERVTASTH